VEECIGIRSGKGFWIGIRSGKGFWIGDRGIEVVGWGLLEGFDYLTGTGGSCQGISLVSRNG